MSGYFEIYNDRAGEFRFRFKLNNGQIIIASEGYSSKFGCLNGIQSVKTNAPNEARYERKLTSSGKFMFNLKSSNGQVIGTSNSYESEAARDNDIGLLKANITESTELDLNIEAESTTNQKQQRIGSVKTYLNALESISCDIDSVLFFRGHSDHTHTMIPSIYRNEGWIKNEDVLFKELILRCPSDFYSSESTFQSLVKMQHYSLPTRLLDITSNPLIALYFASAESSNSGEVVILRIPKREIKYFDSDTVSVLSNISRRPADFTIDSTMEKSKFNSQKQIKFLLHEIRKEKPYFESSIEPSDLESVICVKPKLDNARIIKQDGAFLLFGMDKTKTKPASVPERYIVKGDEDPIIIKSDSKKQIREQLSALGITEGSIYPEIERVAAHIKKLYLSE